MRSLRKRLNVEHVMPFRVYGRSQHEWIDTDVLVGTDVNT